MTKTTSKQIPYLLQISDETDKNKFSNFLQEVAKNKVFDDIKYPRLYEISLDFETFKTIQLNDWVSSVFYPINKYYRYNLDGFIEWYKNEYIPLKNVSIIKHIPHVSLELPMGFEFSFHLETPISINLLKMADIGVDLLFKDIKGIEIKAPYSRFFCDVEKFKDNEKEPLAKYGYGYIYSKDYAGNDVIRFKQFNETNWFKRINQYYDEHHKKLNEAVKEELDKGKRVLILDLHSFSEEQAIRIGKEPPFPDICIGINDKYYDEKILNYLIWKIKQKGYSYQINYPYEGSILPNDVLNGKLKGEIYSFMIEVNKKIYL